MSSIDEALSAFGVRLDPGQFASYCEHTADIPPDLLAETWQRLIRTRDRFPSIHQVRETAAEIKLRLPAGPNRDAYRSAKAAEIEALVAGSFDR